MVDETGYHPESETKLAGLPHLWTCLTLDVSLLWPALTFFFARQRKEEDSPTSRCLQPLSINIVRVGGTLYKL